MWGVKISRELSSWRLKSVQKRRNLSHHRLKTWLMPWKEGEDYSYTHRRTCRLNNSLQWGQGILCLATDDMLDISTDIINHARTRGLPYEKKWENTMHVLSQRYPLSGTSTGGTDAWEHKMLNFMVIYSTKTKQGLFRRLSPHYLLCRLWHTLLQGHALWTSVWLA